MGVRKIIFLLLIAGCGRGAAAEIPLTYRLAVQATNVPAEVLYAVALQESGVRMNSGHKPWPWTLNIAGDAWRFSNRKSACLALTLALDLVNPHLIDVGLAQVNLGWNGHRFKTPCGALDPETNLRAAVLILQEHFALTGDWVLTAGRYHRPAGGLPAQHYREQFIQHAARVLSVPSDEVPKALDRMM